MKHALYGVLRGVETAAVHLRRRRAYRRLDRRAAVALPIACMLAAAIPALGLHVNVSASAPLGLYRAGLGLPVRGAWVAACVRAEDAALARGRGYLLPGPCPGGVEPVLKPVVAVAGDVVDLVPEAVIVNGHRLAGSASAAVDSRGRPLPHAVWGRHIVAADELWLVSTRVAQSWDSRYLGPFSRSQIRAVARPLWTVE